MYWPEWEEVSETGVLLPLRCLLLHLRRFCVPIPNSRRDLWFLADGDSEEIDVSA